MGRWIKLRCEKCGRSMSYDRAMDRSIPKWVITLSQSHCDAEGCDTSDYHVETWLDAAGLARDPNRPQPSQGEVTP